jgi:phenylpyruvate tautomerase PptA (4-oxalocrotonate tautomerase family)
MPLYRCIVAHGLTTEAQRAEIAQTIVRVHCEVTGAPPSFVHAFFSEAAPGQLPDDKVALVLGSIRAGRTDDQKARLASELTGAVAGVLARPVDAVNVVTVDVPARWIMEGGELMPEPGDEAAWLERHR